MYPGQPPMHNSNAQPDPLEIEQLVAIILCPTILLLLLFYILVIRLRYLRRATCVVCAERVVRDGSERVEGWRRRIWHGPCWATRNQGSSTGMDTGTGTGGRNRAEGRLSVFGAAGVPRSQWGKRKGGKGRTRADIEAGVMRHDGDVVEPGYAASGTQKEEMVVPTRKDGKMGYFDYEADMAAYPPSPAYAHAQAHAHAHGSGRSTPTRSILRRDDSPASSRSGFGSSVNVRLIAPNDSPGHHQQGRDGADGLKVQVEPTVIRQPRMAPDQRNGGQGECGVLTGRASSYRDQDVESARTQRSDQTHASHHLSRAQAAPEAQVSQDRAVLYPPQTPKTQQYPQYTHPNHAHPQHRPSPAHRTPHPQTQTHSAQSHYVQNDAHFYPPANVHPTRPNLHPVPLRAHTFPHPHDRSGPTGGGEGWNVAMIPHQPEWGRGRGYFHGSEDRSGSVRDQRLGDVGVAQAARFSPAVTLVRPPIRGASFPLPRQG